MLRHAFFDYWIKYDVFLIYLSLVSNQIVHLFILVVVLDRAIVLDQCNHSMKSQMQALAAAEGEYI